MVETRNSGPSGLAALPAIVVSLCCLVLDAPSGGNGDGHNSVSALCALSADLPTKFVRSHVGRGAAIAFVDCFQTVSETRQDGKTRWRSARNRSSVQSAAERAFCVADIKAMALCCGTTKIELVPSGAVACKNVEAIAAALRFVDMEISVAAQVQMDTS